MPADDKLILVVDDEPRMIQFIRMNLELEGYRVLQASNGLEALDKVRDELPDLVILDVMMPDLDGFETLRLLRETSDVPVIMLTVKAEEDDIVRGLRLGADDYVTKPFSPGELTARVKAHLTRYERLKGVTLRSKSLSIRGLSIDPDSYKVTRNDTEVSLTAKEFEILHLLMGSPDRVFSKEEIFERIWQDAYGDLSTVTVHVRKLREKIEENPSEPEYIETVWGLGYRFKI